jgi:hypothetical protein
MAKPSYPDAAYQQVRRIALGFPGAEEKLSHGSPSFHVRGKMFLTFVDDHHGDGRLAVWCKSTDEEQRRLVARTPSRFYVPPYVGVKGWVGVSLDAESADWIELAMLVEEAWRSVAPPRWLRGEGLPPAKPMAPRPVRTTTDPKMAREALESLTKICLSFPEGGTRPFGIGERAAAAYESVAPVTLRAARAKDGHATLRSGPPRAGRVPSASPSTRRARAGGRSPSRVRGAP